MNLINALESGEDISFGEEIEMLPFGFNPMLTTIYKMNKRYLRKSKQMRLMVTKPAHPIHKPSRAQIPK